MSVHVHLTGLETGGLLLADVLIHKFIDAERQKNAAEQGDPYTTVYSKNIHNYAELEGDTFYVHADAVAESGGLLRHGRHVRAYSYHSPETIEMLMSSEDSWGIDKDMVNEEGVLMFAFDRVPDYHRTGDQLEQFVELHNARGQNVKFCLTLQHPLVELQMTIGDYDETFIVTGENIRPSHLMNSAYALIIADYLSNQ